MEEEMNKFKIIIRLDSFYDIISSFCTLSRIKYSKITTSNLPDINNRDKSENNHFLDKLKDYDEYNLNFFKREKLIFTIRKDDKEDFSFKHFYYVSNNQLAISDIKLKQIAFQSFLEKFLDNFNSKIISYLKKEDYYLSIFNPYKKESFVKKIKDFENVKLNKNKNEFIGDSNKKICKFFIYKKINSNLSENDYKNLSFEKFIQFQKSHTNDSNIFNKLENFKCISKSIYLTFDNKISFKNFLFSFIQDSKNDEHSYFLDNKSSNIRYDESNNTKPFKENYENLNEDFLRLMKEFWILLSLIFSYDIDSYNKFLNENLSNKYVIPYYHWDSIAENEEKFHQNKNIVLLNSQFLNEYLKVNNLNESKSSSKTRNEMFDLRYINNLVTMELDERFFLGFYNIGKRNYLTDNFELHKSIFENNLRKINKICKFESYDYLYCNINEVDQFDNSPLLLAIKLKRYDAIKVLCDNNAEIKHIPYDESITPFDYSIILKNKEILKILINAFKKQKLTFWHHSQSDLLKIIRSIPDFSMEFAVNLNSSIFSILKSITPKDTFKISKKNSNIRIDMNISSLNSAFRAFKGKNSIILKEENEKLVITRLDIEKKISYDYIDSISEIKNDELKVEELIENGWKSKKMNDINLKIDPDSKKRVEKILGYESVNLVTKGEILWLKRKLNVKNIEEIISQDIDEMDNYKNYEEYSKIKNKDSPADFFKLEFDYLFQKHKKVINFMKNEDSDKILAMSFQMNQIIDKNRPLLFSFDNNENINVNKFLNVNKGKIKITYVNKEINNSQIYLNDHEILLIKLMSYYAINPNIFNYLNNDIVNKFTSKNDIKTNTISQNFKEKEDLKSQQKQQEMNINLSKNIPKKLTAINTPSKMFDNKTLYLKNLKNKKHLINNNSKIPKNIDSNISHINSNSNSVFSNHGNDNTKENLCPKIIKVETKKKIINSTKRDLCLNSQNSVYSQTNEKTNKNLIEKKTSRKEIALNFYNSQDFPIKLFHFIPLLHILSFTSSEFSQLNSILCSNFLPFDSFPLKITFPLGLSINGCLTITDFKSDTIQDISISDFTKENKDISSNENFSTALDDKYARDFYDKYFQEKNVGAFSEFSEESFNNDNFLKGSKTNYSELFRDDDFGDNNQNKIDTDRNIEENLNNRFILTELKNEDNREELRESHRKNQKETVGLVSNKKLKKELFDLPVEKERCNLERLNTDNSLSRRNDSISNHLNKNKKLNFLDNKDTLCKKKLFGQNKIPNLNTKIIINMIKAEREIEKKNEKINEIEKRIVKIENDDLKKNSLKFNNIGNLQLDWSMDNSCNSSDFEKTLEENTNLNISKYIEGLHYNKPPDFNFKVKKHLKSSDFNSHLENCNQRKKTLNFNLNKNIINFGLSPPLNFMSITSNFLSSKNATISKNLMIKNSSNINSIFQNTFEMYDDSSIEIEQFNKTNAFNELNKNLIQFKQNCFPVGDKGKDINFKSINKFTTIEDKGVNNNPNNNSFLSNMSNHKEKEHFKPLEKNNNYIPTYSNLENDSDSFSFENMKNDRNCSMNNDKTFICNKIIANRTTEILEIKDIEFKNEKRFGTRQTQDFFYDNMSLNINCEKNNAFVKNKVERNRNKINLLKLKLSK